MNYVAECDADRALLAIGTRAFVSKVKCDFKGCTEKPQIRKKATYPANLGTIIEAI